MNNIPYIFFDNIIFSLQKAGGISVVWENLLSEIQKINKNCYFLEYDNCEKNIFRQRLCLPEDRIYKRRLIYGGILEQLFDVRLSGKTESFIFHSSYYRLCSNPSAINVTTVHDFIYEKGFIKVGLKERIRLLQNYRSIKNCEKIICISENTKQDLFRYIPDVDENKVTVIYNGVSEDYKILNHKPNNYVDFVLFVGGRQKYKNFEFAVNAVKKSNYKLLICGNELSQAETILLNEILGPQRYKFILRPTNKELNLIYNSVHCLFYPSSYEGFGIPILEAQRAGCPVIALNSSSIPEVMGSGGLLLNSLNCSEFISLINDIKTEGNRKSLIELGLNNARKYSWQKMAHEYNVLYSKLL